MKHHTSAFAGVFAAAVCLLSASSAQAATVTLPPISSTRRLRPVELPTPGLPAAP